MCDNKQQIPIDDAMLSVRHLFLSMFPNHNIVEIAILNNREKSLLLWLLISQTIVRVSSAMESLSTTKQLNLQ